MLTNAARAVRQGVWMIPMIIIGERRWLHAPPLADLLEAVEEKS